MKKTLIALLVAGFALTGCSSQTPAAPSGAAAEAPADKAPEEVKTGTRDNPHPLGTTIKTEGWELTVNSVNLDATDIVMAENQFNDAPEEGSVYALVNITVTYTGDEPDGEIPMSIVEYVTADGKTIDTFSTMAVPPEQFDSMGTLYNGASTTGNVLAAVPADTAADGTLAVKAYMLSDKEFFAVS